jgi:hypothetical protein
MRHLVSLVLVVVLGLAVVLVGSRPLVAAQESTPIVDVAEEIVVEQTTFGFVEVVPSTPPRDRGTRASPGSRPSPSRSSRARLGRAAAPIPVTPQRVEKLPRWEFSRQSSPRVCRLDKGRNRRRVRPPRTMARLRLGERSVAGSSVAEHCRSPTAWPPCRAQRLRSRACHPMLESQGKGGV